MTDTTRAKMKKRKAVVEAELALTAKLAQLKAARETIARLEQEHGAAVKAVRDAQSEADSALPQCRVVYLRWRTETEESSYRAVILRRTPSGLLVVRRVGDPSASPSKFKWREHASRYVQAVSYAFYHSRAELRDVPPEYMPTASEQAA